MRIDKSPFPNREQSERNSQGTGWDSLAARALHQAGRLATTAMTSKLALTPPPAAGYWA
jgi:hypothetical protein